MLVEAEAAAAAGILQRAPSITTAVPEELGLAIGRQMVSQVPLTAHPDEITDPAGRAPRRQMSKRSVIGRAS